MMHVTSSLHFVNLKVCLSEDKLTGEEFPSSGEMSSDLKVEALLAPILSAIRCV